MNIREKILDDLSKHHSYQTEFRYAYSITEKGVILYKAGPTSMLSTKLQKQWAT